jgi:hypothetical protein
MVSREATFLISVATEKFIERLTQAGQSVAERQSRTTVQERDICEHGICLPYIVSNAPFRCGSAGCGGIHVPLGRVCAYTLESFLITPF